MPRVKHLDLQFTEFSYKIFTLGCHPVIVVQFVYLTDEERDADRDLGLVMSFD